MSILAELLTGRATIRQMMGPHLPDWRGWPCGAIGYPDAYHHLDGTEVRLYCEDEDRGLRRSSLIRGNGEPGSAARLVDYGVLVPPFPFLWVEAGGEWCADVCSLDRDDHWQYLCYFGMRDDEDRTVVHHVGDALFTVAKENGAGMGLELGLSGVEGEADCYQWGTALALHWVLTTISLCNCVNVPIRRAPTVPAWKPQSKRPDKVLERSLGFSVIDVPGYAAIRAHLDAKGVPAMERRLHYVRGHMKRIGRPENKKQRYWRPHLRGNPERGEMDSTYRVRER